MSATIFNFRSHTTPPPPSSHPHTLSKYTNTLQYIHHSSIRYLDVSNCLHYRCVELLLKQHQHKQRLLCDVFVALGHSAEGTLDTLEQYEHCINNVFASREVTENMQSNSSEIHITHVPQCTGQGSITMQPCSDVTNLCDMDKPVMSNKDHIGVGGDSIRKADISELELIINSLEGQDAAGTSLNCEDNNNVVVHPRSDSPAKPSVSKGGKFTSKLDSKLLTNVGKRLVNQMYRLSRSRSSSVERGDGKQSADTSPARAKHKSNGRLGEHDQVRT